MRDIKFRAWDKIKKQMSDVRVIDWLNKMVDLPYPDIEREWDINSNENEVVLMQYTGLKDNNEKEIYEGDIVKAVSFAKWVGLIKYLPEKSAFVLWNIEKQPYRDDYVFLSQFEDGFEVLGNIYDNKIEEIEKILEE